MKIKVYMILTVVLFLGFLPGKSAFANQCVSPQASLNVNKSIPTCPRPGSSLSGLGSLYPTGSVFVALEDNRASKLISEIYRFVLENEAIPMKLNLIVSDKKNSPIKIGADPVLSKVLNDFKNVNIIPIDYPYGEIRWTQDWLSFVYSNGNPAIFRLTYRGDTEINNERIKNRDINPSAQVAKACQMPTVNHSLFGTDLDQGSLEETMGGNFNIIAGSVWGVGMTSRIENIEQQKNAYAYGKPTTWSDWYVRAAKTYRAQVEAVQSNGDNVVQVNTSIAPVGHFDELFNVLKSDKNKCGFVVLSASSELGLKLLEETNLGTAAEQSDCQDDGNIDDDDPKFQIRVKENKNRNCVGFGKVKINDFLKDEDSRAFSREFQNTMDQNEDLVSRALAKAEVCNKVEFIRVPVLIRGTVGTKPFKYVNSIEYVISNHVNGLALTPLNGNSTFLYGKSYFDPFDKYMSKSLASAGINAKAIYAPLYWKMGGGIHCGTNVLSVCREQ